MKVLDSKNSKYRITCKRCEALLEFEDTDVQVTLTSRPKSFLGLFGPSSGAAHKFSIDCPKCLCKINIEKIYINHERILRIYNGDSHITYPQIPERVRSDYR